MGPYVAVVLVLEAGREVGRDLGPVDLLGGERRSDPLRLLRVDLGVQRIAELAHPGARAGLGSRTGSGRDLGGGRRPKDRGVSFPRQRVVGKFLHYGHVGNRGLGMGADEQRKEQGQESDLHGSRGLS